MLNLMVISLDTRLTENIKRNSNGMIEATGKPGLGCDIDWDYINSNKIATLE